MICQNTLRLRQDRQRGVEPMIALNLRAARIAQVGRIARRRAERALNAGNGHWPRCRLLAFRPVRTKTAIWLWVPAWRRVARWREPRAKWLAVTARVVANQKHIFVGAILRHSRGAGCFADGLVVHLTMLSDGAAVGRAAVCAVDPVDVCKAAAANRGSPDVAFVA